MFFDSEQLQQLTELIDDGVYMVDTRIQSKLNRFISSIEKEEMNDYNKKNHNKEKKQIEQHVANSSNFNILSGDIVVFEVAQFLDKNDLNNLSVTSKWFYVQVRSKTIWIPYCLKQWGMMDDTTTITMTNNVIDLDEISIDMQQCIDSLNKYNQSMTIEELLPKLEAVSSMRPYTIVPRFFISEINNNSDNNNDNNNNNNSNSSNSSTNNNDVITTRSRGGSSSFVPKRRRSIENTRRGRRRIYDEDDDGTYFAKKLVERGQFKVVTTEDGDIVQYVGDELGMGNRSLRACSSFPEVYNPSVSSYRILPWLRKQFESLYCRKKQFFKELGKDVQQFNRPFSVPWIDKRGGVNVTPRLVAYYEVSIKDHNSKDAINLTQENENEEFFNCIAVGLSRNNFNTDGMMPGWDNKSYGYHSDDGCVFHGAGAKVRFYGPSFDCGDTIGCGIDYVTKQIFFTLNGHYLGPAFYNVAGTLSPTIGIDSSHPVMINFGTQDFEFDLQKYMNEHNHGDIVCELMDAL